MTHQAGDFRRAARIILDRYYLEGRDCDPAYRGMGRFLRDMREAGFGGVARSLDVLAVDATTGFTRFHGDVAAYVQEILARNPHHLFSAQRGFELIGAEKWAACLVVLKRYARKLGSTAALVEASETGDLRIRRITKTVSEFDFEEMARQKAQWLRDRPETTVVSHAEYRYFLHDHITRLRRRAA